MTQVGGGMPDLKTIGKEKTKTLVTDEAKIIVREHS